jgi:CRISPR-associated protein Csy3
MSLETGMLSFARSLQLSEGVFWGTRWGSAALEAPVEVVERGVRGQSSEAKTDNPGKSNPQVVEAAAVPLGCDGVALCFSAWVAAGARKPWACGEPEVGITYERLVTAYAEKGGFSVLARLYVWNIANARFAWRNRWLADEMRVEIAFDGRKLVFDPARLSLEKVASLSEMTAAVDRAACEKDPSVQDLVTWVQEGLSGPAARFLEVTWRAKLAEAQEVFPSQEYLREEKKEQAPSRVYAKLPRQWGGRTILQASMHSQKIGAALRHIDAWHGDAEHDRPIAVNPYGGVQETGRVLRNRNPKQPDLAPSFYELRRKPDALFAGIEAAKDAEGIPGNVHFLVANLVRGGVFGQKADG